MTNKKEKSIMQKSIDSFEKARKKKKENKKKSIETWMKKYKESMKEENLSKRKTPLEYKLRNVPDYIYKSKEELTQKPYRPDPKRDPFRGKGYSNEVRKPRRLRFEKDYR